MNFLLYLINIIHIFLILFIIISPFTNNIGLLSVNFIIIIVIILHWISNDNSCALTIIEKKIRTKYYNNNKKIDCFTCDIFEPVYDFRSNYENYAILLYIIMLILLCITTYKLYNEREYINMILKSSFKYNIK